MHQNIGTRTIIDIPFLGEIIRFPDGLIKRLLFLPRCSLQVLHRSFATQYAQHLFRAKCDRVLPILLQLHQINGTCGDDPRFEVKKMFDCCIRHTAKR